MGHEREIPLRYPATCTRCGQSLQPGTSAWWDGEAKAARCLSCDGDQRPEANVEETQELESGEAGASAAREWERRKQRREQRIRRRFPRIGSVILALIDDPQSTQAWRRGAEGERILGERLNRLAGACVVVLHDRRIPGSRANIDHLVVTPGGVFVIDAKHYHRRVQKRDVGGFFRSDDRLYVGRRDCTKLVAGVQKQVGTVREALQSGVEHVDPVPVHGILCFVHGDWSLFARPIRMDDVTVTWPKDLAKRLTEPGALAPAGVTRVVQQLAERLPPA